MSLSTTTKVYGVSDGKVAKLTADPAGGSPTYATSLDVPGIKSVPIKIGMQTKALRGDNGPLDQASTLESVTGTVNQAKLSLDVLAMILGMPALTTSGTTPNQIASFDLVAGVSPAYWRFEGLSASSDQVAGAVKYSLAKCVVTAVNNIGFVEEDFAVASFDFAAIPLLSTGKYLTAAVQETTVALT